MSRKLTEIVSRPMLVPLWLALLVAAMAAVAVFFLPSSRDSLLMLDLQSNVSATTRPYAARLDAWS